MIEHHERGAVLCAQNVTSNVIAVGQEARQTARARYSSGFPDFEGGSELKLGYNNERHGVIMGRDAMQLLGSLGFNGLDLTLGQTTGEAHDRDQLGGRGVDEYKSAVWLERKLFDAGVSAELSLRSALAVLGTEPLFDSQGILIDQKINHLKFDSTRDELWAKAVVSADLSELYSPFGPYSAHRLYVQRLGLNATEVPPMGKGFEEFLGKRLIMMANYKFPLKEANKMFAEAYRTQVCNYAEFVYEQVRDGKLDDWMRLTDWDLRFMNDPTIDLSRLN